MEGQNPNATSTIPGINADVVHNYYVIVSSLYNNFSSVFGRVQDQRMKVRDSNSNQREYFMSVMFVCFLLVWDVQPLMSPISAAEEVLGRIVCFSATIHSPETREKTVISNTFIYKASNKEPF